jgi:hypothetical protein
VCNPLSSRGFTLRLFIVQIDAELPDDGICFDNHVLCLVCSSSGSKEESVAITALKRKAVEWFGDYAPYLDVYREDTIVFYLEEPLLTELKTLVEATPLRLLMLEDISQVFENGRAESHTGPLEASGRRDLVSILKSAGNAERKLRDCLAGSEVPSFASVRSLALILHAVKYSVS